MPESTGPLLVEWGDDRVVATLNRPHVKNAIDQETIDAWHALCAELEQHPKILIVAGSEGVFASGADIRELRDRNAADARRGINANAFIRINALPLPVIAAIDGYALGGGAELAYAADLRIGTPRLRIGNPEPSLGILASAGASWRLKEIVGEAIALDLLLTGRVLDADEALAARLVTELHSPEGLLPAAHRLADRIARNDPEAIMATKRVFRASRDEHPAIDLAEQAILFERPAKYQRMTEFLERKK